MSIPIKRITGHYAKVMYKQKAENYAAGYVNSALDYKELEKLCKKYEK